MTHIEAGSSEIEGAVHDEHAVYIGGIATCLRGQGIEVGVTEGQNGLDLDRTLTRGQVTLAIAKGLYAVNRSARLNPQMATIPDKVWQQHGQPALASKAEQALLARAA